MTGWNSPRFDLRAHPVNPVHPVKAVGLNGRDPLRAASEAHSCCRCAALFPPLGRCGQGPSIYCRQSVTRCRELQLRKQQVDRDNQGSNERQNVGSIAPREGRNSSWRSA